MEIKTKYTHRSGQSVNLIYRDIENINELEGRIVSCTHAFCFYGPKLVIVYETKGGYWNPPGGAIEPGETIETAVAREVLEESNMKVIKQRLIGFCDFYEPSGLVTQTRSVCLVESLGDFVSDPDGDISKVELIDPQDYKKYFDWGVVGERLMERALILSKTLLDI